MADQNESSGQNTEVATSALESGRAIAALAMEGAPAALRYCVFGGYLIFAAAIVLLIIPPYETPKQLVAFCVLVFSLLVVAILVIWRFVNLGQANNEQTAFLTSVEEAESGTNDAADKLGSQGDVATTPARHISFQIDLPAAAFNIVREAQKSAREKMFEHLFSKKAELQENDVRCNIFVPCFDGKTDAEFSTDTLYIYPGLAVNLDNHEERSIRFRLAEGATGKVFSSGKAHVAKRVVGKFADWESWYAMTPELEAQVDPNLRWILSLPLKDRNERTIAVFNIDGLHFDFSYDELFDCVPLILEEIAVMRKVLERYVQNLSKER